MSSRMTGLDCRNVWGSHIKIPPKVLFSLMFLLVVSTHMICFFKLSTSTWFQKGLNGWTFKIIETTVFVCSASFPPSPRTKRRPLYRNSQFPVAELAGPKGMLLPWTCDLSNNYLGEPSALLWPLKCPQFCNVLWGNYNSGWGWKMLSNLGFVWNKKDFPLWLIFRLTPLDVTLIKSDKNICIWLKDSEIRQAEPR